ncbi:hypothetical protein DKX38_000168 [Salix brachista]|uniref:Uncharacterized protein n=1 Tax=Salix brachista TaxID=2182728 RepID=A0A5N5P009_9ROSI|nr:hypothetical protein DKX38_000168 [Salix brachista]
MAGDQASTSKVQKLVTANFTRLNPSSVKFHCRMRCKIKGITFRLNETCDQAAKLGLQRVPQGPSTNLWRRTPSTCLPNGAGIFGRDEDKKKILELVLQKATSHDSNFDVVPIVGMGGAGKTALAQAVYNHKDAYRFSPKVWVCVSTEFDVMRISKAILESVTYKPCELKEFNQVQVKLRETLSGKRFLLVLDDVWNKNYGLWEALKSPFAAGAPGSKIIVTTRCIDVALTIGTVAYHKLELLLEDDIWSVFVKHALKDGDAGKVFKDLSAIPTCSDITDSRDERIEKDVLGMLQPHQGLKELTINSYSATDFPSWVGDPCFSNMVLLRLENCENCTSLPALGLLKSLKDLAITGMNALQSIGCDIYGEGFSNPFPSLETLYFKDMPGWKYWHACDEEQVEVFPRLRQLSILNCSQLLGRLPYYLPSLEELVICESKCLSVSISSFPILRNLDVDGCKELICRSTIQFSSLNTVALSCISDFSFLIESFMQGLAEVKILKITGCQELTNFWQNGVRLLQHLRSLRYLKIKSCSRLVSLGPEEEGQDLKLGLPCSLEMLKLINCESLQRPLVLHGFRSLEELHIEKCAGLVFFVQTTLPCTLKKLCISYCDNLQCLLEEGKDSNISSTSLLECLDIRNCPSLKCLSSTGKLPSPLRQLVIWDCPELGSVADTFCNLSLEKLEIKYCGKLACLPEGLNMLSHLQEITICNCSSIVSFPKGGFPATSLKKLYIGWCEKLQALPERLRGLTSLVELDIHTCPSIVSFPQDGFPTNLTSLLITNLNFCKPLFDWGLHRLASLTRLFITAGCAHILSFPCEETGMMLPTSLSSLSIVNFPNLQYLSSNGFQNLTSLQELWISDCPMLKSLPENGLPSSLLELCIHGCPLLKNKCKRDTGKEFSKIAQIPCVYIDERFIYDSEDEE